MLSPGGPIQGWGRGRGSRTHQGPLRGKLLGAMGESLAERLARLDTCGVSDALDRLGLDGAVLGIRPMWSCPRIAGQVITLRLRRAEPGEHSPRHLGTAAIEAGGPCQVIVIGQPQRGGAAG